MSEDLAGIIFTAIITLAFGVYALHSRREGDMLVAKIGAVAFVVMAVLLVQIIREFLE